jgi:aryl-alcohol dehydrogenase-like predicted oxidoreductase
VYGNGLAEELIAKAERTWGESIIVADKCGLVFTADGKIKAELAKRSIRRQLESSLRRLRRERIELYQVHWPKPCDEVEGAVDFLLELQREGKVAAIGVCNFSKEQLAKLTSCGALAAMQTPYSIIEPQLEQELLPFLSEKTLRVLVYGVLHHGILTAKLSEKWINSLSADDWRKRKVKYLRELHCAHTLSLVSSLTELACQLRLTTAQLAVAWANRCEQIDGLIIGARSAAQVKELMDAANVELPLNVTMRITECFQQFKTAVRNVKKSSRT